MTGVLCGCQAQWAPSADFGDSVNQAIRAQLSNPNAPLNNVEPKSGIDGVAAKASIDNYQNSFKRPVHNTGSGITGVTQGMSGSSNAPATTASGSAK